MAESDAGTAAGKTVIVVPREGGDVEPKKSSSGLMAVDEVQQRDGRGDKESASSDSMSVDEDIAGSAGSKKGFRVIREDELLKCDKSKEIPFEMDLSAQISA
jgi:hypothetical protein